jgi:glutathione S-transferase
MKGLIAMNLYFSPLACSLASRIALYEGGIDARYTQVDLKARRCEDGTNFLEVTSMGQVPALRTEEGDVITENTAVLQYLASRFPEAGLAPVGTRERAHLQQWLGFIGTELHKAVFVPLLDHKAPDAVKAYSREKIPLRLGVLDRHLAGREFVLERFSIADAYLTTILNWSRATSVDLQQWPNVRAYHERMLKRPSVAKAVAEEFALYEQEQKRKTA